MSTFFLHNSEVYGYMVDTSIMALNPNNVISFNLGSAAALRAPYGDIWFTDIQGADPTGVSFNDAAWVAFVQAVLSSGRAGFVPPGHYKFASQATLDWGSAGQPAALTGARFYGVANRSLFDFTGVTASPAFLHTCTSSGQFTFYGSFEDITIRGSQAGPLVRIGRPGNTDAFNEFVFHFTAGNSSTSASACGVELNGLYNCDLFFVANCGGHGDALRVNTMSFSRLFGSFGSSDTAIHITGGFSFGNTITSVDLEVVNTCLVIDVATAVSNTFIGGQWVWTVGSGPAVAMVDCTAGSNNRIIGPNISSVGTIALHSVGLVLAGSSAVGTEQLAGLSITPPSGDGVLTINSVAGNSSDIFMLRGSSIRWQFWRNNSAESGSNVGSDLLFSRYSDVGAFIDTPMFLSRSTGQVNITTAALGNGGKVGFFTTAPGTKPTVTGSRGANAALASLITALAGLGLITDSTTA